MTTGKGVTSVMMVRLVNYLTTKRQTTKLSSANSQKDVKSKVYHTEIHSIEGKQCRSR